MRSPAVLSTDPCSRPEHFRAAALLGSIQQERVVGEELYHVLHCVAASTPYSADDVDELLTDLCTNVDPGDIREID